MLYPMIVVLRRHRDDDDDPRETIHELLPGVRAVFYGETLGAGTRSPIIYVRDLPTDDFEHQYVEQAIRPRLVPGGRLFYGIDSNQLN